MRLPEEFRQRTRRYASAVVRFYSSVPARRDVETLAHQLLRAGTSVAAQVREASRPRSDAEFCSKLDGALQEADESQLWLELLKEDCGVIGPEIDHLLGETNELIAILVTFISKTRRNQ